MSKGLTPWLNLCGVLSYEGLTPTVAKVVRPRCHPYFGLNLSC